MMSVDGCPFCEIIKADTYEYLYKQRLVVRIQPLNPVARGHRLFVPAYHTTHPDPDAVGAAMTMAAEYARGFLGDYNLITSSGRSATQTVAHIHVHFVPRVEGDGLALPWTGQKK